MASRIERGQLRATSQRRKPAPRLRPVFALAFAALALCGWAATIFARGGLEAKELAAVLVATAWTVAGALTAVRRPAERIGPLVLVASLLGALGALATAVAQEQSGAPADLAQLARPLAAALLPAAVMHLLLALPDGTLQSKRGRGVVLIAYIAAAAVGIALWTQRPFLPLWPLALEGIAAAGIGFVGSNAIYVRSTGIDRERMQWVGLGLMLAAEVGILAVVMSVLLDWPSHVITVVVLGTLAVPVTLALGSSRRNVGNVGELLAHAIALAGLTSVVGAVYFVIVLGLGRVPQQQERTLLLLSMIAAAVAALVYLPAREAFSTFANRVVYGAQRPPDEALRTLGSRLSRPVGLDELLLQLAESLRRSLGLSAAEVWTGTEGRLQRTVSDPNRDPTTVSLSGSEGEGGGTRRRVRQRLGRGLAARAAERPRGHAAADRADHSRGRAARADRRGARDGPPARR